MPIDSARPVRTFSGHIPVRVLCTNGPQINFPIYGIVEGEDRCRQWTIEGKYNTSGMAHPLDLENTPIITKTYSAVWITTRGKFMVGPGRSTKRQAVCDAQVPIARIERDAQFINLLPEDPQVLGFLINIHTEGELDFTRTWYPWDGSLI